VEFIVGNDSEGLVQVLFPVKFDTLQNFIDFNTIIRTADGIKDTYRGADIALFGSAYESELIYGAADPGSVTTWVGKKLKHGAFIGASFAVAQFSDGFLENATGKTFRDWGGVAGDYAAQLPDYIATGRDDLVKILTQKLIEAETCRRFLEMNEDEFEALISERPDAASIVQSGRRKFYEACRANEDIPSVTFGNTSTSIMVPRSDFSKRTKRQTIEQQRTVVQETGNWVIETLEIEVTSPNWERLDQQRGWKGKLRDGTYIYFHITDSRFWTRVAEQSLVTNSPDRMVAQVIFQDVGGRYKNAEAIKVIEFNGDPISAALTSEKIRELIANHTNASRQFQTPLFMENED